MRDGPDLHTFFYIEIRWKRDEKTWNGHERTETK